MVIFALFYWFLLRQVVQNRGRCIDKTDPSISATQFSIFQKKNQGMYFEVFLNPVIVNLLGQLVADAVSENTKT